MRPHTLIASVSALVLAAVLGALALPGPAVASQSASAARGSRIVLSPHRGQVVRSHHLWLRVRAPMLMRGVQQGAGALRVSLNGTPLGQRFQRPRRGIRRLRASISQGLRRGRNMLRVSVRRRDGSIRRAKVRFFVRPRGPMVGAGLNRRVAVGATIRLTGRVAPARRSRRRRTPVLAGAAGNGRHSRPRNGRRPRMRMRWKVVGHPRRRRMRSVTGAMATKKAALTSPTGLTARFRPAVPGRYTIQLTARRGDDATSDRVTVTAVPGDGPLVPIDTWAGSKSKPGIKIGDTVYDLPKGGDVQVVVLDRHTLAVKTNRSYPFDNGGGGSQISDALKGLDTSDLVIAVLRDAYQESVDQRINDALGAIGTPEAVDSATCCGYSAIGVPSMRRGDASITANVVNNLNGGGLKGYLTPDQFGNYGFVPSQRVPFSYPADIPCSARGCGEGFKVRVQDEADLTAQTYDGDVYNTNGIDLTDAQRSAEADRMASDINDINATDPHALVTIEAVTSRLDDGSGYRAPVGPISGDAMNRLAAAIASVGGTRNAFNLVATKHGTPASGGHVYMLVGWARAGEGNGAEAAAGVNGTPDAPTLTGVLRPDRQSRLRPQAVSTQGGDPDALANEVMKPPSHDWWPHDGDPHKQAEQDAICYLGMNVLDPPDGLGCNPRLQYWTAATLNTTEFIGELRAATYPGGTSKFSNGDFERARRELITEFGEVGTVRQYMGELAQPFAEDPVVAWAAAHTIADHVYTATNAPKDGDTTYQWLDFTKILLELAGPLTDHATTAIASLIDLGMWIAGATDKTGAPSYDEVNIKADALADKLVNQAQDTVATYNRIGNIIVSDPAKLRYFGDNAGCNPDSAPVGGCPIPALEWNQDLKAQASANYYRAIQRYLYQQLMPLGYRVFQLLPSDEGYFGAITLKSPPDIHKYVCEGTIFSFTYHPWSNYPTGSDAATSLLTQFDPSAQNGVYTTFVWSEIPDTNTQHGEPPPDGILKRMFEPVPADDNDPNDGGLGMSPQLTMADASHYLWEGDQNSEQESCYWEPPS